MTVLVSTILVSTFCCSVVSSLPAVLRLGSEALHRVHHVALLLEKRVAEIVRPRDVFGQALQEIRNDDRGLNARIPGLLLDLAVRASPFSVLVLREPLLRLDELERVRRGHERLGQQRVGIERDRRDQRVELVGGELDGSLRGCRLRPGAQRASRSWPAVCVAGAWVGLACASSAALPDVSSMQHSPATPRTIALRFSNPRMLIALALPSSLPGQVSDYHTGVPASRARSRDPWQDVVL